MEKIILKKIISESPRTYGDPIDFYFSIPTTNAVVNENRGNLSTYKYNSANTGTDLNSLNPEEGDRWQAFDTEDKPLGFIVRYNGHPSYNWADRNMWMIYNEEIGAFSMQVTNIHNDGSVTPQYLFINNRYFGNTEPQTLSELLELAETKYNRKEEPYTEGMDCSKWNLFQFGYFSEGEYYTNRAGLGEMLGWNVKMRYFSSWYKLITGAYYKELLSMKTSTGETFYFGKILGTTEQNACVADAKIDSMRSKLSQDASYGYTDLVYGTDIGMYTGSIWGQEVVFENGLRLGFEDTQWDWGAYAYFRKVGEVNFKMKFRNYSLSKFEGKNGITGYNNWYQSRLSAMLSDVRIAPTGDNIKHESVDVFVSPTYNEVEAKNFKEALNNYNFSTDEWKQMLGRVVTFVNTVQDETYSDVRTKFGYTPSSENGVMTIAYNGWAKIGQNEYAMTSIYSDDPRVENTFGSREAWQDIIDFIDPTPTPPGPDPEPEPEPEPEKKSEDKICIGTLAELAIKNAIPFLGDYEKLEKFEFMQEYLEDFTDFDFDIMETRYSFIPMTKKATLEESLEIWRKRSAFTIKKHAKELEHLWDICNTEYSPEYNVEEHIEETVKKTGSDTLRDAFDSVQTTDTYGEQGSSATIGAQTGNVTEGAQQTTTTNENAGFNSSDYQKNSKSTTDAGAKTTQSSTGSRTDSSSVDEHTDSHVTDYREDVHEQTYDNTVSRKYDRKGNVGTMSTPELLQKAADVLDVYDFYNKLYDLILGELAYYFDDGLEPFERRL